MTGREEIIAKLEKEVKRTYAIKTAIYEGGEKVEERIIEHREPFVTITIEIADKILALLKEQEADKNKYEYKYDHTDCLWYGSGNCPSTCSQYRDGWNDAMDYIFKDGKGYQPYRKSVE